MDRWSVSVQAGLDRELSSLNVMKQPSGSGYFGHVKNHHCTQVPRDLERWLAEAAYSQYLIECRIWLVLRKGIGQFTA